MEQLDGKERILKVAMDLIMKQGYNSVSIRKIVKKANVSIGTLYYHFPQGKLSILNSIFQAIGDEFIEVNSFPERMIKDPIEPETIRKILKNLLIIIRKYSPLIQGILMEIFINKGLSNQLKNVITSDKEKNRAKFIDLIRNILPESSNRDRSLVIFANIILNIIFVHVYFEDFYGSDKEVINVLISMIKGFFSQ